MTSYKFNSTYSLLSNREQFIVLTSATEKDRLVKILSPFSFFKYKRHFSVRGSLYFLTLKHFSTSYTCHPHSKTQSIPVQILFLNNHPSRRIFDSENNKKKTNKFETLSHPFTHALSLSLLIDAHRAALDQTRHWRQFTTWSWLPTVSYRHRRCAVSSILLS